MKFTGIEIDGFGAWSGLTISGLSDQLNVIYGPNEAGKTTLLNFLRSVLYGFSAERRARYLPPLAGGRPGGAIHALGPRGAVTIRRGTDERGGVGSGYCTIVDSEGTKSGEPALHELFGEVDEATFNNVFAFGLREIQELSALADTEAGRLLYDLSLGLDRVSLADVVRSLDAARNRLLDAAGGPSIIRQLSADRDRLQSEITELEGATSRYIALGQRRAQLADEIHRCEAECEECNRTARTADLARALAAKWRERADVQRQLAAFGGLGSLGDDALARLDQIIRRSRVVHRRSHKLKRRLREQRHEAAGIAVNEGLCRAAPRLEALREQQGWLASLAADVRERESRLAALEARRRGDHATLAATSTSAGLSPRNVASLRAAAKTALAARHALREAKALSGRQSKAAAAATEQIRAAMAGRGEHDLLSAVEKSGSLVTQLRRRVQLDERIDQLQRRRAELDEQSRDWLDRQVLPAWLLAGLGGLFAVGVGLILSGLFLPASIVGSLGWPLALLGVGGTAASAVTKVLLERSAARRLENCQQQSELLGQQLADAQHERDALDASLPRGGGALVSRLQSAQANLTSLEELLPLDAQREEAARQSEAAENRRKQSRRELRQARHHWQAALTAAGLPADMTPNAYRDYYQRRDEIGELNRQIEEQQRDLAARRRDYATLAERIGQLAVEAGLAGPQDDPQDSLRRLLVGLDAEQRQRSARELVRRRAAATRRKLARLKRRARSLIRSRREAFARAGLENESSFRRRVLAVAEARLLRRRRDSLAAAIAAAIAGQSSEETLGGWLADETTLEARVTDAHRTAAAAHARLQKLSEERGELSERLRTLAADRRLDEKRFDLAASETRLDEALARWQVLATCSLLVREVRDAYELTHQPEALRRASEYLSRLTGGRYMRVWTPLDAEVLRIDGADGRWLPVEVLSRGAREQLFLSLRLAIVDAYVERGVNLPLVLDDVLVNFDAVRLKAAAAVLRDFARGGRQLFVFTCHEHIAKLFKTLKAEVRQLPDRDASGAVEVKSAPPVEAPPPEPPRVMIVPKTELPPVIVPLDVPVPEKIKPPEREDRVATAPVVEPRTQHVARVAWDAEEFSGELADRVRGSDDDNSIEVRQWRVDSQHAASDAKPPRISTAGDRDSASATTEAGENHL